MQRALSDPFTVAGVDVPQVYDIGGVGWPQLGKTLAWCAVVQLVLFLLCSLFRFLWVKYSTETHERWLHNYIGHEDEPPHRPFLDMTFRWIQFGMSITTVVLWIYKTYAWRVGVADNIIELTMCAFFVFGYFLEVMRYEFKPGRTFSANCLLDVITVVPLVLQSGLGCESSGALHNVEEFTRAIVLSIVKFFALIILFAGTMYIFEILGDIEGFQDKWVDTNMGYVSFFSMVYYIIVTISTVGYGDYTPVTVFGRLFVIVVILGGVLFFSMETGKIMTIVKLAASGKGPFTPRNPKRKHVLVIGGGVTNGPISVLESFLKSLLDVSHGELAPEVVLMGNKEPGEDIHNLISQRWAVRANVKYLCLRTNSTRNCAYIVPLLRTLVWRICTELTFKWIENIWNAEICAVFGRGNPTTMKDLKRARIDKVELCFVLADLQARAQEEDLQNIVRAAAVYRSSHTPMLVMLMDSINVSIAVQSGLPERMCCSIESLEIAALASSTHCQGLSTLIINLALPDLVGPQEYGPGDKWLQEYIDGGNKELYGLQLALKYSGMDFSHAAREIYVSTGVMLIACQDETGEVVMNPGKSFIIKDWTVFFCIAEDEDALTSVRRYEGRDWLNAYEANRAGVAKKRDADRARLAAKMQRPGFLALGSTVYEDDEDALEHRPRWEDGGMIRRTPSDPRNRRDKKTNITTLPGLKAGHFASLAKKEQKEQEKRKSTVPATDDAHAMLFEADAHVEDPDLLHDIVMQGDHIVVLGLTANLFPQFVAIIRQLRNTNLPQVFLSIPIVILYDAQLPVKVDKFLHSYENLVYVRGDPLKLRSLITAGVDRCSKIIVVAGAPRSGQGLEPLMMDQDAILLLSMLESQINLWGRAPDVICEMQVPANILQLAERFTVDKNLKHSAPRAKGLPASPGSVRSGTEDWGEDNEEPTFSSQGSRTHVRYASGQVIHRAEFSSLFAAAFYTPGVLDLLRSMCQPPTSQQTSIVWKLEATRSMIGQTFSKTYCAMVDIDAIPIAICRKPNKDKGNALPIVYTCPQADAVIMAGDSVYIISTPAWCEAHPEYTEGMGAPIQHASPIEPSLLRQATLRRHHSLRNNDGDKDTAAVGIRFDESGRRGMLPPMSDKATPKPGASISHQSPEIPSTGGGQNGDIVFSSRPPRSDPRSLRASCPVGHRLKKVSTPEDGWGCDACFQENFPAGSHMHGCRACRWVCCGKCFKSLASAATSGIAEGAGQYSKPEVSTSPRGPGTSNVSNGFNPLPGDDLYVPLAS